MKYYVPLENLSKRVGGYMSMSKLALDAWRDELKSNLKSTHREIPLRTKSAMWPVQPRQVQVMYERIYGTTYNNIRDQ